MSVYTVHLRAIWINTLKCLPLVNVYLRFWVFKSTCHIQQTVLNTQITYTVAFVYYFPFIYTYICVLICAAFSDQPECYILNFYNKRHLQRARAHNRKIFHIRIHTYNHVRVLAKILFMYYLENKKQFHIWVHLQIYIFIDKRRIYTLKLN